jgi:signal transduction histidine kinase
MDMKRIRSLNDNVYTNRDPASTPVHYAVVCFAIASFIVLMVWQALADRSVALQFRYNPFVILPLLSLVSSIVAFVLIARIKRRTTTLMWFSAFLLSIIMWAIGEMFTRLSATPEAAMIWAGSTTPGSVFMPITLYMFVLSYTNSKHSLSPLTLPSLLGVAAVFTYIDQHSNLLTNYDPMYAVSTPWGFVPEVGPAFILIVLWAALLPLAAIGHLHRFKHNTLDPTLHKQASLFIMAIAIPLIGGALTDGAMPFLGLNWLPPLSVVLLTVMGITISYGILRYHFFSFTPGTIAEQILGTMNEAVIGLRPNLRISYANAGAEELFGIPAAKLTNMRIGDFLKHRMTSAELKDKLQTLMNDKPFAVVEELQLRIPNRPTTSAKASITRLDDDNQPYGYLVVMTDITALVNAAATIERKVEERTHQLHEAQAKLRASIEGLSLGFALLDEHNNIVIQNKALEHLFKLHHAAATTEELEAALSEFSLSDHCDHVRKSGRSSEAKEVELGSKVLHIFIAPVTLSEDGRSAVIGCVVLVQDVTEDTVLARSRDEFFSIASHELRTPLTTIKGNASLMIDYHKELLNANPSLKEMVFDIHTSSARLIGIVNDFLDVSRIEQGKMIFRFEPVALDKIIESVFYEMRTIIQEKHITLSTNTKTLDVLPKVWADKNRLTQVIYNLVGNAVKFTDSGGVTISVTHDHKHISVRVTDSGRGITLQNQKLLFHKFQQANSSLLTRDAAKGTGLGLYISKLIAKSMHGALQLEESKEGVGSTFLLTIPVATPDQLTTTQNPAIDKIDAATGLPKK